MTKRKKLITILMNYTPLIIGLATVFFHKFIFGVLFPVLQIAVLVLDIVLTHNRRQFGLLAANFAVSTALYLVSSFLIYHYCELTESVVLLIGYEFTWILVPIWIFVIVFCFALKNSFVIDDE